MESPCCWISTNDKSAYISRETDFPLYFLTACNFIDIDMSIYSDKNFWDYFTELIL